jgi:uncharacterized protein (TIGR00299 family) protein
MKIAYFDCFAGASGDMILGALLDAGLDLGKLQTEISKLGLEKCGVDAADVVKKGISGTRAVVTIDQEHHGHHHRHLSHIREIIRSSSLDAAVKDRSLSIFTRLAETEARVHACDVESVHFHEVGAVDAIIDVVGAVAGIHLLGIEECHCSPIHLGSGTITCTHGVLPVPAPATALLVQGLPVYATDVVGELLTPTGAAILSTLCAGFGPMPPMVMERIGYGAGMSDPPIPNLLRIAIGEAARGQGAFEADQLAVIETNVDDMSPQVYEHVMEKALGMGALDVFMTSVQMKKNRPGTMVTVTCKPEEIYRFAELLMTETTSIGIRWRIENRLKAKRELKRVETPWGAIRVKFASIGEKIVNVSPEYDDCKKAAVENGVPLKQVMDMVRKLAG